MSAAHIPSPQEVAAACSGPGGWTRKQLAAWGVGWPPPRGWRRNLKREWERANQTAAAHSAKKDSKSTLLDEEDSRADASLWTDSARRLDRWNEARWAKERKPDPKQLERQEAIRAYAAGDESALDRLTR